MRRVLIAAAVAMAVAASGCGGGGPEGTGLEGVFVQQSPEPDLLPTEEDLRDRFEGIVTDRFDLLVGTCFNQYSYRDRNDLEAQLTTAVGCTRPHDGQVYAIFIHDAPRGTPYPGEEAVDDWGERLCYEQFETFVGLSYEKSLLGIGMITPSRTDWEGEKQLRRISCFVHSYYDGLVIRGTMAGISL